MLINGFCTSTEETLTVKNNRCGKETLALILSEENIVVFFYSQYQGLRTL